MWNGGFVHTVDTRYRRPSRQRLLQSCERFIHPFRRHFHRAVREVSHHSTQSQAFRLPPHEPAVPHPLHPSVHSKSHRGHPVLLLAVLRHASTIPPHVHSGDRRQDRQENEHRPPRVRLRFLIQDRKS